MTSSWPTAFTLAPLWSILCRATAVKFTKHKSDHVTLLLTIFLTASPLASSDAVALAFCYALGMPHPPALGFLHQLLPLPGKLLIQITIKPLSHLQVVAQIYIQRHLSGSSSLKLQSAPTLMLLIIFILLCQYLLLLLFIVFMF